MAPLPVPAFPMTPTPPKRLHRSLLIAALALPVPLAAQTVAPPPPRVVAVSGNGEVRTAPDRAQLSASVFVVDADIRQAEDQVNAVARRYLDAVRALGARDNQIQSAGASIQPEYVWDQEARTQKLVGYRVARAITVQINDLDKLGAYLLAATKAGVNQVQPPVLESSKAADFKDQALVRAAQDAERRARLLAETLGAKLGPVRNVQAMDGQAPVPMGYKAMAVRAAPEADSNAEMGLSTGEIVFAVDLSAEFELLP